VLTSLGVSAATVRERAAALGVDGDRETSLSADTVRETAQKGNVLTCRITDEQLAVIDALVGAGIRSSRSDATAWLIQAGIYTNRALIDRVYANPQNFSSLECVLATVAYTFYIYFDFSAYSDIAIGSGRLFGIAIPENFDWPYARTNIAEFWGHWHRSLTRWLTDYVFIPLGGSRARSPGVYANVMTTMLISGLWHGAGLNFLVWGAWHGLLLVVHRAWRDWRGAPGTRPATAVGRVSAWALTFTSVTLGWAFFAMDLETAVLFMRRLIFG